MARAISIKLTEKLRKSYGNNLTPWLREQEETKELKIVFKRSGFAYSIEIPGLGRIRDITNRIQAPKAYFGYLLLRLARRYGLNGSGILILRDKEAISLMERILSMRLNERGNWRRCVELVREFERISSTRRIGEVIS